MNEKPKRASGYAPSAVARVRSTLLFIAAKLGDLMDDIVVVGGLVPYLLVEQKDLPAARLHVGTMDLDLGLSLGLLDGERYQEISIRLRAEGFMPAEKEDGQIRRQSWVWGEKANKVTVDFLIPPNDQTSSPGKLTHFEKDFAAITIEGLDLAFQTKRRVTITGRLPNDSTLTRSVFVCGPAAFVVLKSKAFRRRGENKDAYDIFYLLREMGTAEVFSDFRKLDQDHPDVSEAFRILQEDFVDDDGGRAQVAEFLEGQRDDAIEGDVLAQVSALLRELTAP